jgi:hypothetical protein
MWLVGSSGEALTRITKEDEAGFKTRSGLTRDLSKETSLNGMTSQHNQSCVAIPAWRASLSVVRCWDCLALVESNIVYLAILLLLYS